MACSLVDINILEESISSIFRLEAFCIEDGGTIGSPKILIPIYLTTWHHIPEDGIHHNEHLKSHTYLPFFFLHSFFKTGEEDYFSFS
jgi:hypothetical protein